jgi:hypothetical protein
MQDSLASVEDLAVLMRTSFAEGSDEEAQAEMLLQMASAWARGVAHRLWPTTEDIPALKRDTVVGIILAAVRRELTNPRRVVYEVHGPDSASYNQAACPPGFFTEEERRYLLACKGSSGSWWVQGTYRDDPETTAGYLYSSTTRKPFPMYAPHDTEGWGNSYHL